MGLAIVNNSKVIQYQYSTGQLSEDQWERRGQSSIREKKACGREVRLVQALAEKDALSVENIAQFKDACLAAAKLFGWDGKPAASVTVNSDKTVVVCTEEQRLAMIEARERFLNRRADVATHPPNADSQPSGIANKQVPQSRLRPRTPPGRTQVPEDPQIAWMRSHELSPEDQEQVLVPGGAKFTPFWEPMGVSEADLYRR